jgi:hypothetical protein
MFTDRYKNRTAGIIFFAVIDGGRNEFSLHCS